MVGRFKPSGFITDTRTTHTCRTYYQWISGKVKSAKSSLQTYFVVPDYYEERPKPVWMAGVKFSLQLLQMVWLCLVTQQDNYRYLSQMFVNKAYQNLVWVYWFNHFRGDAWMPEGCRSCPDKDRDFGGCRCQAYMLTGDASNADPVCGKSLYHQLIEQARAESEIDSSGKIGIP